MPEPVPEPVALPEPFAYAEALAEANPPEYGSEKVIVRKEYVHEPVQTVKVVKVRWLDFIFRKFTKYIYYHSSFRL